MGNGVVEVLGFWIIFFGVGYDMGFFLEFWIILFFWGDGIVGVVRF